jgi:hypothetical protein
MELPTATTIYDKVIQHARQYVFLLEAHNIYPGTTFLYTYHCRDRSVSKHSFLLTTTIYNFITLIRRLEIQLVEVTKEELAY